MPEIKRITLHPLKEDGTVDTNVNLYPKTLITGISDGEGNPIDIQEKLIAGENISIDGNVISATAGGGESTKKFGPRYARHILLGRNIKKALLKTWWKQEVDPLLAEIDLATKLDKSYVNKYNVAFDTEVSGIEFAPIKNGAPCPYTLRNSNGGYWESYWQISEDNKVSIRTNFDDGYRIIDYGAAAITDGGGIVDTLDISFSANKKYKHSDGFIPTRQELYSQPKYYNLNEDTDLNPYGTEGRLKRNIPVYKLLGINTELLKQYVDADSIQILVHIDKLTEEMGAYYASVPDIKEYLFENQSITSFEEFIDNGCVNNWDTVKIFLIYKPRVMQVVSTRYYNDSRPTRRETLEKTSVINERRVNAIFGTYAHKGKKIWVGEVGQHGPISQDGDGKFFMKNLCAYVELHTQLINKLNINGERYKGVEIILTGNPYTLKKVKDKEK